MFATFATKMTGIGRQLFAEGLRLAPWGGPGAVFGAWMVWPALTDDFKRSVGILPALPEDN
eukprot:CAMPEP_0118868442 /NCGR_PEP_ID=MMETSP1163-20130328/11923_1 /TAXON_ID=124430 /ORGANISM="Phaeomonas parva, Strain CCMP2877" /LENGTH=60 /DNA_ID=CAMNT_0006803119 /DNA_START=116 /DNA_END=298 /DNA_ORIENTATION=-